MSKGVVIFVQCQKEVVALLYNIFQLWRHVVT